MTAAPGAGWWPALPAIETLSGCFESGLLVIDQSDRLLFCSEWMAFTLSLPRELLQPHATTGRQLMDHIASTVPNPPPMVRERLLLAPDRRIACEEFEIAGPPRSVVRWVARHVSQPEPALVVVCTDITAEVDLAVTRERQAVTDALTGLLNRRGIEPQIFREMHLSARHMTPLSVALLDIDHFKQVNDRHGHNAGDQVLHAVADTILHTVRAADMAARWGGEEFLVMLPQTDLEPARRAGERIRAAVEALRLPMVGPITLSGGVARFDSPERLSDLIGRADKRLYEAKGSGRNCIR